MIIAEGKLRGELYECKDGSWACCIWYPMSDEDEDIGLCFDFALDDIDDLIKLLTRLKENQK